MATTLTGALIERGLHDFLRLRLTRELIVAPPGAGSEWSAVCPAGVIWEVLAAQYTLTTSAVVANRVPRITITNADGVVQQLYVAATTQPASVGRQHTHGAGLGTSGSLAFDQGPLPTPPIVVRSSWTVATITGSLDVGDAYTAIVLTVREWSPQQVAAQARWIARNLGTYDLYTEAIS